MIDKRYQNRHRLTGILIRVKRDCQKMNSDALIFKMVALFTKVQEPMQ